MKTLAQSSLASRVRDCARLLEDREARSIHVATEQAAAAAAGQGRGVFSSAEGRLTDLRSVPEQSLADSIFSL